MRSCGRKSRADSRSAVGLCKLHHAAFDRYLIGVTPDLEVTVRLDVLKEIDGPMLQHGLQGFQGRRIHVPRELSTVSFRGR